MMEEEKRMESKQGEYFDQDGSDIGQEEVAKLEKTEKDRQELLNNVVSGHITSMRERIAYILNQFPKTRNSDIELAWTYWEMFERDLFDGYSVTKEQLFSLTRVLTITRHRAKIQNEYRLFQADDEVRRHRGVLNEEKKENAITDKPVDLPLYSVFVDETGKTQDYLSVGSLWIVDSSSYSYGIVESLNKWKEISNIEYEFHFAELTKYRAQAYKDFFLKFLSLNPTIGFKIIVINNSGFADINDTITHLTFHLIHKGVLHENSSGRAPLPRVLQVWLDEEEKGSDRLKLENLRERLQSQKIDGLHLRNFEAVSSKNNYFIQAVDLVTSSVNRKLHSQAGSLHFKDDVADYILGLLNFDVRSLDRHNSDVDKSMVFNLTPNVNAS